MKISEKVKLIHDQAMAREQKEIREARLVRKKPSGYSLPPLDTIGRTPNPVKRKSL